MIKSAVSSSGAALHEAAMPSTEEMIDRTVTLYSTHGKITGKMLREFHWTAPQLQQLVFRFAQTHPDGSAITAQAQVMDRCFGLRQLLSTHWGDPKRMYSLHKRMEAPVELREHGDDTVRGVVQRLLEASDLPDQLHALQLLTEALDVPVEAQEGKLSCDTVEPEWLGQINGAVEALLRILHCELSRRSGTAKVSIIDVSDREAEYAVLVATLTVMTQLARASIRLVYALTEAGAVAQLVLFLEVPEGAVRKMSVALLHRLCVQNGAAKPLVRAASGVAVLLNLIDDSDPITGSAAAATLRCLDVLPPKQIIRGKDFFEGMR